MARKELDPELVERGTSFGKKLKDVREKSHLTQAQLSQKANVSIDTLRSIESGRITTPGVFMAADLVHALDGKLDEWVKRKRK